MEGGGLAATGGADHQEQAAGLADQAVPALQQARGPTQLGQRDLDHLRVEQSDDHVLAVLARHRRQPQLGVAVPQPHAGLAVLRSSAVGHVHVGDDLQAADQGLVGVGGQPDLLPQHAVDAVADPDILAVRLDVDVARLALDRVDEQVVHQVDVDLAALAGQVLVQLAAIELQVVRGDRQLPHRRVHPPQHAAGDGLVAVVALHGLADRAWGGHDDLDAASEYGLQLLPGGAVAGVGHRHDDGVPVATHREDLLALGEATADPPGHRRVHRRRRQVAVGKLELEGQRLGHVLFGHRAEPDQRHAEANARFDVLHDQGGLQQLVHQARPFLEQVADQSLHVSLMGWSPSG